MKLHKQTHSKFGDEIEFTDADHGYRVFIPTKPGEPWTYSTKVNSDDWKVSEHWRSLPPGPKQDELKKAVAEVVSHAKRIVELLELRGELDTAGSGTHATALLRAVK